MAYSYKGLTDPTAIAAEKAREHRITMAAMSGGVSYEAGGFGAHHPAHIAGSRIGMRDPKNGELINYSSAYSSKTTSPHQSYKHVNSTNSSPVHSPKTHSSYQGSNGFVPVIVLLVGLGLTGAVIAANPFNEKSGNSIQQPFKHATSLSNYTHYVTTDKLNVRHGPGTQHEKLPHLQLSQGDCIRATHHVSSGWLRATFQTNNGLRSYYLFGNDQNVERLRRPGPVCP